MRIAFAKNATPNIKNAEGSAFIAISPFTTMNGFVTSLGSSVKGSIIATNTERLGTLFTIDLWDLPTEGGPFYRVPSDGNCIAIGGHLDPFGRGDTPPCDSTNLASCQVGDLSEKYGKIGGSKFAATYADPFVSFVAGDGGFLGDRLFVLHFANKIRYACFNFISPGQLLSGPKILGTSAPGLENTGAVASNADPGAQVPGLVNLGASVANQGSHPPRIELFGPAGLQEGYPGNVTSPSRAIVSEDFSNLPRKNEALGDRKRDINMIAQPAIAADISEATTTTPLPVTVAASKSLAQPVELTETSVASATVTNAATVVHFQAPDYLPPLPTEVTAAGCKAGKTASSPKAVTGTSNSPAMARSSSVLRSGVYWLMYSLLISFGNLCTAK